MNNGFYKRSEIRIVVYERGDSVDDIFAIIINEEDPEHHLVITGQKAEHLIADIANHISAA